MPDLAWNKRLWDQDYAWPKDGDEWDDCAKFCGVPYDQWKDSLARTFLIPHLKPKSVVLEIGPGHGRWSVMIPERIPGGIFWLIDMSASCINFCKKRMYSRDGAANDQCFFNYVVNDGRKLEALADGSVDFVWSFDTFVHIEEPEIRSYARELARVMKHQSMGVIHHSGTPTPEQRRCGMRSEVGLRRFGAILAEAGLHVVRQASEWGPNNSCNMMMTADCITVFARP